MGTRASAFVTFFTVLALSAVSSDTYAVTKIAPTAAEAGHPFTVIDTPEGRLLDGSVAVFRMAGLEVTLPLRTHKPFNTAQGWLTPEMYGGEYMVFVRQPGGTEIAIGSFTVFGATAPPPSIAPDMGAPGDAFTITDPLARIQTGDLALFYAAGSNPADGAPASGVVINPNGMSLSGNVPSGAAQGVQNFVSVRPTPTADARFGDLGFFVATGVCDCSAFNGWYDVGGPYQCCDGTSGCVTCQDQQFRTYTCSGTECTYSVTSIRTLILP